ncbi:MULTISPECIES: hypothetical protein [unclassified Flavobacterium]|uniref:hypothetical protein n=1 Tax=unclassified Flavobacterium TaxID=196869 RepID=UPI00086F3B57|nr:MULTISPECIES: hypothetical protein [unclassified Flavobacterium]MBN9283907.1 hypothetical protein [Flavobacterium sp.]ODS80514.1 MAG: hypothetical protein ABS44_20390 [Chryseobacterium sp. SCN 40-13]OJV73432.1 MAG: hypothetical protein BGO42_09745 [Flavobacterium sp. 40-81]
MNTPCIIIPILVGLICALLGYLLGKVSASKNDNTKQLQHELDKCRTKSVNLSAELEALKAKGTGSSMGFAAAIVPFDGTVAATVFGRKIVENDLKIIEGIGPKIEELFNTSGIFSWKALSEISVDRCNEILHKAGERFVIHNPATWPRQARMAYEGKWQELKDWQEQLDGGKE